MSFREVRAFVEAMRTLGYPRTISLDNFRTPNFELVADCLQWLAQRLHPDSSIPDDIATEAERVAFLQAIAQTMLSKVRLRLNLKRLYAADGQAVREMLRLAGLLCKATATAEQGEEGNADSTTDVAAALRALDARATKDLAARAVRAGAALHDALAAEPAAREARARALSGGVDADAVEHAIAEASAGVDDTLSAARSQISDLAAAEVALDGKLERRRAELERAEKRLATLAAVRPAYQDEYDALETQLQALFGHYVERHRNLQYLEAQLEGYRRAEAEAMEAEARRLKKLKKRLADEEMRILRGEAAVDESRLGATSTTSSGSSGRGSSASSGGAPTPTTAARGAGDPTGWGFSSGPPRMRPVAATAAAGAAVSAAGAVIGSLAGGGGSPWGEDDEDDASIDEDSGTEDGELSLGGGGGSQAAGPAGGGNNGGSGSGGSGAGGGGGMDSEDSGF